MEDPFYGNGAGVQLTFPFAFEQAEAWLVLPYHPVDIRPPLLDWVLSRSEVGGQRVSTGPYGSSLKG